MDYTISMADGAEVTTEPQSKNTGPQAIPPLISVVIPARNKEALITQTLDSLLNQPYRHLEIIVVDDGSTDDTAVVLEPYQERIRYFYLEHDERSGPGRALNLGIQEAKGEYVHGLAAGDQVTEMYYIQTIQEFHARPHIGAVVTDAYRVGEGGTLREIIKRGHFRTQQDFLLEGLDHNPIIASTAIVKKFCYEAVGLYRPEHEMFDDYELWLRLGAQFEIAYLTTPLIQCRALPTNQTWNLPRGWAMERRVVREFRKQTAIETFFPELREQPDPERYAQAHERIGRIFNRKGWRDDAEAEFEKADSYRAAPVLPAATEPAGRAVAMHILFVLHDALPRASTGTALHTVHLAQAMQNAGHEVVVLYPNYAGTLPEGSLKEERYEGLKTYALTINASDFSLNLRNDRVARAFNAFLQEHAFDFVHFQHLLHLGGALLDVARKQGVPMVQDLQALYSRLVKSDVPQQSGSRSAMIEAPDPAPIESRPAVAEAGPAKTDAAPARKAEPGRINVALYALDQINYACPIIRLVSPLTASPFAHRFNLMPAVTFGEGSIAVNDCLKDADIVVLQRGFPRVEGVEEMMAYAKSQHKPVIYETDDNLIDMPEGHPQKEYYDTHREHIIRVASQADMVTVSTPKLRDFFRRYNANVSVLPNLIDLNLWSSAPAPRTDARTSLVYMGTLTHEQDINLIAPALKHVLQKYQGRVALRFWGYVPPALRHVPGVESVGRLDNNYLNFVRDFRREAFDIALAPLAPTDFNRYKSHIKYLEYSACHIPGIYARLEPYFQTVRHGVNGLLAGSDPEEWIAALERLIEDESFRRTLAENAYRDVAAHHAIGARCQEWVTLYERLLKREIAPASPAAPAVEPAAAPATQTAMKASVVIPVFNQAQYTQGCLEALFANTPGPGVEVLVVDNGSTDDTADRLAAFKSHIKLIRNETNLGFARACNQGARAARGEYIVFLNNDTLPQPGWLEALVSLAEQEPQAAVIGAKLLYPNETVQHAGVIYSAKLRLPYHIYQTMDKAHPAVNRVREYPAVTGACMLVRRSVFFDAGLFDEEYVNCYEDVDFCLKVAAAGYKVLYTPHSVVYHYESATEGRKNQDNINRSYATFRSKWDHKIPTDEMRYYSEDDLTIEYLDEINLKVCSMSEAEQQLNRARRLKGQGRFGEALSALEMVTEEAHRFEVCLLKGDCGAHLDQAEAAAGYYQAAMAMNAQSDRPHIGLGVLAVRGRRTAEAKGHFEQALALNPQSDNALCGLGITLSLMGQSDEALEQYTRALKINPQNLTALSNLQACAYELKTYGLAEHHFRRYLAARPDDLTVRFGLAGIYALMGATEEARATLHHILKLNPNHKDAAQMLSTLDAPTREAVS